MYKTGNNMAYELNDFLIDWFKGFHLSQMPEPVRKRLEDMRSGDDIKGQDYVVITSANQSKYREYITKSIGDTVYLYATKDNLKQIRSMTRDENITVGEGINFVLKSQLAVDKYHNIFPVKDSPKVGEKIYLNDFRTGGQKLWFDAQGDIKTALPDISKLDIDEQRKFYRILRNSLRVINANPPKFADPDIPQPVLKFFGDKNFMPFSDAKINNDTKEGLRKFALHVQKDAALKEKLKGPKYYQRFTDDYTIDQFLNDLISMDYDTDSKIKEKAVTILGVLNESVENASTYGGNVPALIKNAIDILGKGEKIAKYIGELDAADEKIDEDQFRQFQDSRVYGEILKALYDPKVENRQSGFFKQVAEASGREITNPMTTVIENVNYDKITPKYKDERTFWQEKKKNWDDWQDDHTNKFWDKALRHYYLEPNAKGVVSAIKKLEIPLKDGLKGIVSKKEDIKKILNAKFNSSVKGFEFFCECIEDMEKSDDMKNALAGALRNGKQCAAVAREIIKRAVAKGRVADAKVALETLAVMRYNIFSAGKGKEISKAITGANFLEGVSFMNNKAIAFVMNAAQKGFNLGVAGVFWTGVGLRNSIQHLRGQLSDKDVEAIEKSMAKIAENSKKFKTPEEAQELWEIFAQKLNKEKNAVKKWKEKDIQTGKLTEKHSLTVQELLEMRNRLNQLDDGSVENKIENLEKKLVKNSKAQKRNVLAEDLMQEILKKQQELDKKKVNLLKDKEKLKKLKTDSQDMIKRKQELKTKIPALEELVKVQNQLSIAQNRFDNAKTKEEKGAAKNILENILSSKIEMEINLGFDVNKNSALDLLGDYKTELKELNNTLNKIDIQEKNLNEQEKELKEFGADNEQGRSDFIYMGYEGEDGDQEALDEHIINIMETEKPEKLFKIFGFAGMKDGIDKLKKSADNVLSKNAVNMAEADLQLGNKLRENNLEKMEQINELLSDYDGYVTSERICHEEYNRLSTLKARGLEKNIPEKEYGGASSENEQIEELMYFWNVANGFESEIQVNDYNIFNKHQNIIKTQEFKNFLQNR